MNDYITEMLTTPEVAAKAQQILKAQRYPQLVDWLLRIDAMVDKNELEVNQDEFDSLSSHFPIESVQGLMDYVRAYAQITNYDPFLEFVETLPYNPAADRIAKSKTTSYRYQVDKARPTKTKQSKLSKIASKLLDKGEVELAKEVLELNIPNCIAGAYCKLVKPGWLEYAEYNPKTKKGLDPYCHYYDVWLSTAKNGRVYRCKECKEEFGRGK